MRGNRYVEELTREIERLRNEVQLVRRHDEDTANEFNESNSKIEWAMYDCFGSSILPFGSQKCLHLF